MATIQLDTDQLSALLSISLSGAGAVDALAALCLTLNLDPTLWPLTATTTGRVLTSMGRQAGLREAALTSGSIQLNPLTHGSTAVPAVAICNESHVPAEMETALVCAGVEPDVLASLYFDEQHGQAFRQRIKSKWRTFTDLVSRGLVQSPTGFFVSAVRKNWHLSSTYEPGKKKTPTAAPSGPCLPVVGALVRVAGDLSRVCRVMELRGVAGEWKAVVEDIVDGAVSVAEVRKLRAG